MSCVCTLTTFLPRICIWDTAWSSALLQVHGTKSRPYLPSSPLSTLRRSYHRGWLLCTAGSSVCCTPDILIPFRLQKRKRTCSQVSYTSRRLSIVLVHFSAGTLETYWIRAAQECLRCLFGWHLFNRKASDKWLGTCYCRSEKERTRRGTVHGIRVHTFPSGSLCFQSATLGILST